MSEPAVATPVSETPKTRRHTKPEAPRRGGLLTWIARLLMVVAGLAAGLVVAEMVFRHRDGGAFPHVNFYQPDAKLGVRLLPNSSEDIAFGGNPITHVRTNSAGYRGAEWPAATDDAILVVGDSQVFGLGVQETDTFSAKLATELRRPVINAGVPTYGPKEYEAVIGELLDQRHPKTVVLTLNLVNDLFELSHPNIDRHAVWDGWAVRKENAPTSVTNFPFRSWLMRNSHLVFAWRKWRHSSDAIEQDQGVASEGSWTDIVEAGKTVQQQRAAQQAQLAKLDADSKARREAIDTLKTATERIDSDTWTALEALNHTDVMSYEGEVALQAASANPGDIVFDHEGEEARSIVVTAEMVRQGALQRKKLRAEVAAWAAKKAAKNSDAKAAAEALTARDQALETLSKLAPAQLEAALEPPLGAYIREVNELCVKHGARLVVAILPIDVQVSADEWKKYDATPQDMTGTTVLAEELVASANAIGVSALDATPVLKGAEPGAFLNRDIHMTAKGHDVVAKALATLIQAKPPVVVAAAARKLRTLVPVPELWRTANEVIVPGSTAAGCETKRMGEWFRVLCGRTTNNDIPTTVEVVSDPTQESMVMDMPFRTSLITPVEPGRNVTIKFGWTDKTRDLTITWPEGAAKPTIAFADPVKTGGKRATNPISDGYYDSGRDLNIKFRTPAHEAICKCWGHLFGAGASIDGEDETCSGIIGTPDPACVSTYDSDCARMIECIQHDPASPPKP